LIDFAIASRQYSFGFGEGFPGRVWKQKKPVYISDYTSTQAFSRSDAAQTAGLNYTFGIPIIYKNNVYGVLQLFSKNIINPDADFLALMENIGKILGEFILHIHNVGQLQDISRHDLLTGLLNRSAISEEIDNLISDGKSKSISVIVLDIDRFKLINEAFGHQFGDRLLNSLATKLNALINPANHTKINLARLGADKFILYISESNRDEAYDFACTINHTINNPIEVGEQKILLSMSIGIAIYPQNGHDSNTLITAADLALIQAKDLGGNRINFFTKELPLIATKAMAMDTDLRKAISNNQFFLEYQPQIDLKTGNICCVEALVRWQHPITGLISPGDFIPFAEKIGLMVTLNEHIMRMVFQQISSDWPGPPVSINISAQQFREGFHLVEYLESLMKEFSISSKLIELEITENMLFEDTEHDIAVLNALNGLGFQIAIDDFGTGFSALGYLNRIPVHKVKIDKSLITGLPDKVSNAKIVTGMIAMIHTLDMLVVAEGADSKTEVNFLIQKKCDIVQGFYYYKPMSFDALTAIINKSNVAKDID
jgi:diguanylate cyclase (GGDEF)-like protein